MMDVNDETIEEFINVTKTSREQALTYLRSNDWALETALSSYFEDAADNKDSSDSEPEVVNLVESPEKKKSKAQSPVKKAPPRFVTMASLRNRNSAEDEEDEAYYAGGSEHSGQQILGPGKGKRGHEDQGFFDTSGSSLARALRRAAQSQNDDNTPKCSGSTFFTGTGYRLGDSHGAAEGSNNTDDSDQEDLYDSSHPILKIRGNNGAGDSFRQRSTSLEETRNVRVTLYEDGFNVDDGPLRSYTDPSCADLVETINRGEFPASLIPESSRGSVNLCVSDKRSEKFPPPKKVVTAFGGTGHLLGRPSPSVATFNESSTKSVEKNKTDFNFSEEGQPSTTLKVRLPDGSVLQLTLNVSITIKELRNLILKARPHLSDFQFSILSTFPRREFQNPEETLEEAGIQNACLVVKLA